MSEFVPKHKKQYGQHFLKESWVLDQIFQRITVTATSSVFEIGGGAGFLTRRILAYQPARLWVFEIDPEWASYLRRQLTDPRLTVLGQNILDFDFTKLAPQQPWLLIANLPYQVTFPILYRLQAHRQYLQAGVIMVQEEVAQKLVKTHGRDYGYTSLYFQYYFDWELLAKIPPTVFEPAPKVFSRLLYFQPKTELVAIPAPERFWQFVKLCFRCPRRTLRNNLAGAHYQLDQLDAQVLGLRAQQMSMSDFLTVWQVLKSE